jgi:nitric oxide synthase-interacting protein
MSNTPISMKDLIDVKFKFMKDKETEDKALIAKTERYVCAVSNDILGNSIQSVVLRTS